MAIDFLGALGAGSDIDTVSLVDSLVAAERAPKESQFSQTGHVSADLRLRLRLDETRLSHLLSRNKS